MKLFILVLCFFYSFSAIAGDEGFRFKDGKCINKAGEEGLNKYFFGQCADFRGVKLNFVELEGIDFRGSNFEGADLSANTLTDINFSNTKLITTKFKGATIIESNFSFSDLRAATFNKAVIIGSQFSRIKGRGIQAESSKIQDSQFGDADLRASHFQNAILDQGDYSKTDLRDSDFSATQFKKIDLSKASFENSQLEKAQFSQVKAISTDFHSAMLKKSTFDNVDLKNSRFRKAVLKGARFSSVKYSGIDWMEAEINKKTELPFSKEEAVALGMLFSNFEVFHELNGRAYARIKVKGIMSDTNVFKACEEADLRSPCPNESNGQWSDDKCLDVGWRENGQIMSTISASLCDGASPSGCPALNNTFNYMGQKWINQQACGVVDGRWCADGVSHSDLYALCVEE